MGLPSLVMPRLKGEVVAVRVEGERLATYQAAAGAAGLRLPEWVRSALDAASGLKAPPPPPPDPELEEASRLCALAYAQPTPGAGATLAVKMLGTSLADGIDPLGFPGSRGRLERAGVMKPTKPPKR